MRKTIGRLTALLLSLTFALGTVGPAALAAPTTDHVSITKPTAGSTWYLGEKIPLAATLKKYETNKYEEVTQFKITVTNVSTGKNVVSQTLQDALASSDDLESENPPPLISLDEPYSYGKTLQTAKYAAGKYTFKINFTGFLTHDAAEIAAENGDYDLMQADPEDASVSFTLKKLLAPANPNAIAKGKAITLKWKKAAGAAKYEVWRSVKNNKNFKKIKTTTADTYVDKSVKQGLWYYYRVRSLRDKNGKVYSGCTKVLKTALPLTAPSRPSGVKAKAGKKKVTVTWKAAKLATRYEVWRSKKKNSGYKKVYTTKNNSKTRTFVDKKVARKKKYYYKVRAVRVTQVKTLLSSYYSVPAPSGKVK